MKIAMEAELTYDDDNNNKQRLSRHRKTLRLVHPRIPLSFVASKKPSQPWKEADQVPRPADS
jgi:hypothetical protein